MQDIIENPLYLEEHLGLPIPGNIHAVSVCLPTWSSVVNYEENDEVLKAKLQSGYPRFVLNPVTLQLIEYAKNKMNIKSSRYILPYPSRHIATKCMKNIRFKSSSDKVEIIKLKGSSVYLVVFAKDLKDFAWEFWQHTGQGLSSRQAEAILNGKKEKSEE